jgi:hypothetical protein
MKVEGKGMMKTKRSFKTIASQWHIARRTLGSERGVSLIVVIMLMVIILAMTSAGMFFSSVELRASGNHRAGTQAFYAADTGINVAYAQIGLDPAASTAAIPVTQLGGGLAYQSAQIINGTITPVPIKLLNTRTDPGYSLNAGTGYNTAGYVVYQYQINMTGTGPLSSAREVEAQVEYGPVPK